MATLPTKPQSISDLVFSFESPVMQTALEEYRIKWEKTHGKVDLTKNYASTWTMERSDWLYKHDTKRWFENIPEFVQDFLRERMQDTQRQGELDNIGDRLLKLYLDGDMNTGRGRGSR